MATYAKNSVDLFYTFAKNPTKPQKYGAYRYANTGYRLTVDESGVVRSYDLPIGGVLLSPINPSKPTNPPQTVLAFYAHYRNSTITTNRHIGLLYHAIRQIKSDNVPLFYVSTIPTAGSKMTDIDRHEQNAQVYANDLTYHLKRISQPRLRIKSRVDAWRNSLHTHQALVDYARFHAKLFPTSTLLRKLARTAKPQLTNHMTPKQIALAALNGHEL